MIRSALLPAAPALAASLAIHGEAARGPEPAARAPSAIEAAAATLVFVLFAVAAAAGARGAMRAARRRPALPSFGLSAAAATASMVANLTLATVVGYGEGRFADRWLSDALLLSTVILIGSALAALERARREGDLGMAEDRERC